MRAMHRLTFLRATLCRRLWFVQAVKTCSCDESCKSVDSKCGHLMLGYADRDPGGVMTGAAIALDRGARAIRRPTL